MQEEAFPKYVMQWKQASQEFLFASLPFKDREKHLQQAQALLLALPSVERFTTASEKMVYDKLQEQKSNLLCDASFGAVEPFAIYANLKTLLPPIPAKELSDIIAQEFSSVTSSLLEFVGKTHTEVPASDDATQYAKNLMRYSGKKIASSLSSLFETTRDSIVPATPLERSVDLPYDDMENIIGGSRLYVSHKDVMACRKMVDYFLQSPLEEPIKKAIIKETLSYALEDKGDVFSHFISTVLVRDPLLAKQVVPILRAYYEADQWKS